MIYFDNAASSFPKPIQVTREVYRWLKRNGANPGRSVHKLALEASELIYETRSNIADLFGVNDEENIAFVPNATYGLNMIIQGVLKNGDHVVTTDIEHNSVLRPLELMRTKGISYDVADIDFYDDDITVERIMSKIKKNTVAIVCTQCSNVCGKAMPIKKISGVLPSNVKLIVDGSQGAGSVPVNIIEDGIDYYCAPSHKGLLGPQGSGFVAVCNKYPEAIIAGGTGSDSFNLKQPKTMPDLMESGTLATPAICGLNEGIKYIKSVGVDSIGEHKKMLSKYAVEMLGAIEDVELYFDYNRMSSFGVVCFNIKGRTSDSVASFLADNGVCVRSGIHCAPLFHKKMGTANRGMVRASFGSFNNKSEIDFMIKIINKYLKI